MAAIHTLSNLFARHTGKPMPKFDGKQIKTFNSALSDVKYNYGMSPEDLDDYFCWLFVCNPLGKDRGELGEYASMALIRKCAPMYKAWKGENFEAIRNGKSVRALIYEQAYVYG